MNRRIRVAECPHCGKVTPLDRKTPQPKHEMPGVPITTCLNCFFVFENEKVESRLVERQELISSQG